MLDKFKIIALTLKKLNANLLYFAKLGDISNGFIFVYKKAKST